MKSSNRIVGVTQEVPWCYCTGGDTFLFSAPRGAGLLKAA